MVRLQVNRFELLYNALLDRGEEGFRQEKLLTLLCL